MYTIVMEKLYMNIKEAAETLGVSKLTLRNWDKAGKLHALRHPISNYRVYKTEDLKKLVHKMESGEKPERIPRIKKNIKEQKSNTFKVKVLHLKD
jgi:DNA (cytosine-5)-methyltransferase 1